MTIMGSLARYGRRQLHTIISRDIIKPSSPTPSHLKTYNLSLLDQINLEYVVIPVVTFFPNNNGNSVNHHRSLHDKTLDLKKSLSQTLTKYYPFAGRHAKFAPNHIDCNDGGVEFIEASVDTTLSDFLQTSQHEDLDSFFPYDQVWSKLNHRGESNEVTPLAVQVNHFECGGVAVAVSLSHKIADGSSLTNFFSDWGKMTRLSRGQRNLSECDPIDPHFLSFPSVNLNFDGFLLNTSKDCVTRSFMFPNSKINDLKRKVISMTSECTHPITNPTRVEVLDWLLYKSAVAAAIRNNKSDFFAEPIAHGQIVNIRNKMNEKLPENSIGNFFMPMKMFTNNESELKPEVFINELKKQKMQLQGLQNIGSLFDVLSNMPLETDIKDQQRVIDRGYGCSSMCRYPTYEIDFGWGKPVKATFGGHMKTNSFILMDAPNKDGIEALVCLEKEDMELMQNDPELLAFL